MASQSKFATLNGYENVLDAYDQVTYHLKFFMMPQIDTINKRAKLDVDSSKGIVIAESGVTSQMFIEDVNLKTVASGTKSTINNTSTTMEINIREFSGASLLDKIYYSSLQLGIDNYHKCPYFMEVTFVGRNPLDSTAIPKPIGQLKYVYPLTILTVETDVDAGGAYYAIKAAIYDNIGHRKEVATIGQPLNANVSNVQEAIDKIAEHMNNREPQKKVNDTTNPNRYEIVLPTDGIYKNYGKRPFVVTTQTTEQKSSTNLNYKVVSERAMGIKAGISVTRAINIILQSTEEYQKGVLNTEDIVDTTPGSDAKKGKPRELHRIDVSTIQGDYDEKLGDYQKTFVYKIIPYQVNTIVGNAGDADISTSDRVKQEIKNYSLQKEYNYLFTGLNDQVLDFQLKFNFSWTSNIAAQGGLFTQNSNASEGPLINKKYNEVIVAKEKESAYEANKPSNTTSDTYSATDSSATQQSQSAPLRQNTSVATASNEKKQKDDRNKSSDESKEISSNYGTKNRYVSDTISEKSRNANSKGTKKRVHPIGFSTKLKDYNKSTTNMGDEQIIEGALGPSKQLSNSIFEQAFSGGTGDLVTIDMTIKGDPYWLESNNKIIGTTLERQLSADPVSYNPTPNSANTTAMENYFVFRVKTPDIPKVQSGLLDSRPTTLDGVYRVITVEHTFATGKFTQTIKAVIDPIIKMEKIDDAKLKIKNENT